MKRTTAATEREIRLTPTRRDEDRREAGESEVRSDPVASLHRAVGNRAVQQFYGNGGPRMSATDSNAPQGGPTERDQASVRAPPDRDSGRASNGDGPANRASRPRLTATEPDDPSEREAERVARAAVEGGEPVSIMTRADETTLHRKPDGGGTGGGKQSKGDQRKRKRGTQAVEYRKAISTLGKAFMQTELGKRLKHEGKELGMEFWSTVGGKVVTLTAAAGGLTFLGVTNRPLPLQPPAFRPDALIPGLEVPGLHVQVAYQGPARDPTKVGLGASFQFGAESPGVMVPGLGDPKLRLDVSSKDPFQGGLEWPKVMLKFSFTTGKSSRESQKAQDQGGSLAKELHQFRQSLKTPEERAAERRILMEMLAPGLDLSEVQRNAPDDSLPGGIQRKLAVNEPDDKYEREAERVADTIMRMPEPSTAQATPRGNSSPDTIQRLCPRCRERHKQGKPLNCPSCENELQRKEAPGDGTQAVDADTQRGIESLRGGGRPLPESVRSSFETRFGYDFSDVRVHTGTKADEVARSIDAEAFTAGQDIAFRDGKYDTNSRQGKKLIAHELTHIVQQGGGAGEVPKPRGRGGSGILIQRQSDAGYSTPAGHPERGADHEPPQPIPERQSDYCPEQPVKDPRVDRYIGGALADRDEPSRRELKDAFSTLRNQREDDCCNLDLAAAEHYMYARREVATGSTSYWSMVVLIRLYAWVKYFGLSPLSGDCPLTPTSSAQVNWALRGAEEGREDYERFEQE